MAADDQVGPGPSLRQPQDSAACGGDDPSGDREQTEPQTLGFPEPGGQVVPGEGLGPDDQLRSEAADLEPDLVLVERLQRQVRDAGVFEVADAVLAAGAEPVLNLQFGQPATFGVGGEHGYPPPVVIGDPQLGAGVGSFLAGDDPHSREAIR